MPFGMVAINIALVLSLILFVAYYQQIAFDRYEKLILIFIIGFCLSGFLSAVCSGNVLFSVRKSLSNLLFFAILSGYAVATNGRNAKSFLFGGLIGLFIAEAYTIIQIVDWLTPFYFPWHAHVPNKVSAFFGNSLTWSGVLLAVTFYLYYLLHRNGCSKQALALLIVQGVMLTLLARRSYVIAYFSLLPFLLFRSKRVIASYYILTIALFAIVITLATLDADSARIVSRLNPSTYLGQTMQIRLYLWDQALVMFLDNPVFGVGPGMFRNSLLEQTLGNPLKNFGHPHSIYLHTLAEQGLVGCFFFVGIWWSILRAALATSSNKLASRIIVVAIALFLLAGGSESNLYDSEVQITLVLVVGALLHHRKARTLRSEK